MVGDLQTGFFHMLRTGLVGDNTNKGGKTEWHNVVMWRSLADVAAKFLQKGKLVYVEGKLRTRAFEDKDGVKKYTTEVIAENFTLLGRKNDFDES